MSETDRRDYMRSQGFTLATDAGHQAMEAVHHLIEPMCISRDEAGWFEIADSPSAAGLGLVAHDWSSRIAELLGDTDTFLAEYGVEKDDLDERSNLFGFQGGLGDQNFTSHFAPGLANAVVEAFETESLITSEQRAGLTFGDWSTVIGSKWFSEIVHDMALTRNGVYQEFGTHPASYQKDALIDHLGNTVTGYTRPLFESSLELDAASGMLRPTAKVSATLRLALRNEMKGAQSPGCPVARHTGSLPLELLKEDSHTQRLVATGRLAIRTNDSSNRVRFSQEVTPIDAALRVFANHLYEYDLRYGTPTWRIASGRVIHERRPMVGI